ncbi:MAG TPA: PAS domain S-box protein [Methanosarcinaceae archaeon]|nr:PAS domain S-box protein [Methanosarcinaceae archaeon]
MNEPKSTKPESIDVAGQLDLIRLNKQLQQEIDERKRAEDTLRVSEERLCSITENLADHIMLVGQDMKIQFINKTVPDLEKVDVIGKNVNDVIPKDFQELAYKKFQSAFETGKPTNYQTGYLTAEGDTHYFDVRLSPVTKEGKIIAVVSSSNDITERKQMEEELRESEEKYEAFYGNAPLSYQSLNEDGSFNDVNPAWLRTLGYDRNEVIGKWFGDFLHPDWKPHFEKNFQEFKRRGYVHDVQFKIKHKDGHYLDISFEGYIGNNPDGSFKQTYCVFQDITERKQAEKSVKESELRYRSLTDDVLDTLSVGIFILDSDFQVVWVNHALERYFGLRRKEIIGKDKRQLIRERIKNIFEDPVYFTEKLFATYDDNTYIEHFECHIVPDSEREERWLEHWSQPIQSGLYAGGRVEHYSDITERKQADDLLRLSEERYRTIFETAANFITSVNEEGIIMDCNDQIINFLGYEREEIIGQSMGKIIHPDYIEKADKSLAGILETGFLYDLEYKMVRKDGEIIDVLTNSSGINKRNGVYERTICITSDITERKQAENEIIKLNEGLEQKIKERTSELEKKNRELKIMVDGFVVREGRVIELKKQIAKLKNEKVGE